MKKFLMIISSLVVASPLFSQTEKVTKVIDGVDNLVITTNRNTTTILAERTDESNFVYQISDGNGPGRWGFNCPFVGDRAVEGLKGCCKAVTGLKQIYWGWDFNYGHKDGLKNCFEVGVAEVIGLEFTPFRQGPEISVGLGFGMRRYLVQNGLRFEGLNNNLLIRPEGDDLNVTKSRVDSWTFHVPVMATQKIYKELAVSLGAWLNFNTYVKGETQYYTDDSRFTEHYKGFNQRFCTVDIVGIVGLKDWIGFYGRWSPMSLFRDGRGPKFRTVSIGVSLNF